jgi:carbon starvation protein
MLVECVIAIMALIATMALQPADYFSINSTPEVFKTLGMTVVNLPELSREIDLELEGQTGGAVTLAVGVIYIFTEIPKFSKMASYKGRLIKNGSKLKERELLQSETIILW